MGRWWFLTEIAHFRRFCEHATTLAIMCAESNFVLLFFWMDFYMFTCMYMQVDRSTDIAKECMYARYLHNARHIVITRIVLQVSACTWICGLHRASTFGVYFCKITHGKNERGVWRASDGGWKEKDANTEINLACLDWQNCLCVSLRVRTNSPSMFSLGKDRVWPALFLSEKDSQWSDLFRDLHYWSHPAVPCQNCHHDKLLHPSFLPFLLLASSDLESEV